MARKVKFIIGSRASGLAMAQSEGIRQQLACLYPDRKFDIKKLKTKGDEFLDAPLAKIGGRGLFTKELDEALVRRELNLAVHTIKDRPLDMKKGVAIGAITRREDPHDAHRQIYL